MSVELAIRLGSRTLSKEALHRVVAGEWRQRFDSDPPSFTESNLGEDKIGMGDSVFRCEDGKHSGIECRSHSAGTEESLGEDGGWWLYVSVVPRTNESFLLMLLVAACVAKMLESAIIDEAGLMRSGRYVDHSMIFAASDSVDARSVSEASRRIGERYG